MFVLPSDYDGLKYNLPRLEQIVNSFQPFVDEEERAILDKLLGSSLSKLFYDALAALPADWVSNNGTGYNIGDEVVYGNSTWESLTNNNLANVPVEGVNWTKLTDDIYLALKNGDTYTINGQEYVWKGVKDILVPYIYFRYISEDTKKYSGIGAVIPQAENSIVVPPTITMVSAWNEFARKSGCSIWGYFYEDSLYGFLKSAPGYYPTYREYYVGLTNEFDL